jgi:hypothetical protein
MLITGLARLKWTDSHPVYYHRPSQASRVFLYWYRRVILCGQCTLTLTCSKAIDGKKVRQVTVIPGKDSDSDSELALFAHCILRIVERILFVDYCGAQRCGVVRRRLEPQAARCAAALRARVRVAA